MGQNAGQFDASRGVENSCDLQKLLAFRQHAGAVIAGIDLDEHAEGGVSACRAVGDGPCGIGVVGDDLEIGARSEEHTSELQSLMRISYAVFCLKKKNNSSRTDKT